MTQVSTDAMGQPICGLQDIFAHNDSVRKVALSPNDMKFVTASDDSTLKVCSFPIGCA